MYSEEFILEVLFRTDLCDTVLDNLLARQIGLVANKELVDALGRIPVNLLEPLLDVREGICPFVSVRQNVA